MATIAATAFGAGSMVASIGGMNMKTDLSNQDGWVFTVTVFGIVLGVLLLLVVMLSCLYGRRDGHRRCGGGGGCGGGCGRCGACERSFDLPRLLRTRRAPENDPA